MYTIAATGEAAVVVAHVQRLLRLGVRADQIGVITPYNAQLEVMARLA
jgi:superfamily I DNA and/or RNA helicase